MATIWPVYEGKEPTRGGPWARIALDEVIPLFELQPDDFISNIDVTPRFGDTQRTSYYQGYRHVVVEVDDQEARRKKWKAGFYKTHFDPQEAFNRLIKHAVARALGVENVVRIETTPVVDSAGKEALKIMVVIAPDAIERLANGAALNALVNLQDRLREMRDDRNPIIEYATEAELAEEASY